MVITGEQTEYLYLRDDDVQLVKRVRARIPGRTSRGGQSQNRIQRLRDEAEGRYIGTVAEEARAIFENKVTDLVLIGPANKKNLVHDRLYSEIRKLVRAVLTGTGKESPEELVELVSSACESKEESPWVKRFLDDLATDGLKAVYGSEEIKKGLRDAMLEVIIVRRKPSAKLLEKAKEVGCEVVKSRNHRVFMYGDVVGMRWFSSSGY